MERVKVVVMGREDAGKSTLIKRLAGNARNIEHSGITVSMDLGYTTFGDKKVFFFGTPGQERFDFMRKVLSEGVDFGIVVIDSSRELTKADASIISDMKQVGAPYMVFLNKTDLGDMNHDFGVQTVKGSALHGDGVNKVVETVLSLT